MGFLSRERGASGARHAIRYPDGSGRLLAELLYGAPDGAVVTIAPGRYTEQVEITRPVTLRGAGDLTRFIGRSARPIIRVDADNTGEVRLESLALEDGDGEHGGALSIARGHVRLHNLHIRFSRAVAGGGAIGIAGGDVYAERIRIQHAEAGRGGGVRVHGRGVLRLADAQISHVQAGVGGALCVEDAARVVLERATIARSAATETAGGQAIYVGGSELGAPVLYLHRVRLKDAPLGVPVFNDPARAGDIRVLGCDMPRLVLGAPNLTDDGENVWR